MWTKYLCAGGVGPSRRPGTQGVAQEKRDNALGGVTSEACPTGRGRKCVQVGGHSSGRDAGKKPHQLEENNTVPCTKREKGCQRRGALLKNRRRIFLE